MTETLALWILLGICLVLGVLALVLALRLGAQLKVTRRELEEQLDKQDVDLAAMLDAGHGMGNKLNELQRDMQEAGEKLLQLEQRDLGALPYNEAVRMVANGAGADQLVEQCGLSRAEADLVLLLHRSSPPTIEPLSREEFMRAAQAQASDDSNAAEQPPREERGGAEIPSNQAGQPSRPDRNSSSIERAGTPKAD